MELRNLIDKILLSAADLISLSAGVKRKDGWGRGERSKALRTLSPTIFLFVSKHCRVSIRTLQLLLNNVKGLSQDSSKVIHRKDREILLKSIRALR